jgi:hypothetical protein
MICEYQALTLRLIFTVTFLLVHYFEVSSHRSTLLRQAENQYHFRFHSLDITAGLVQLVTPASGAVLQY